MRSPTLSIGAVALLLVSVLALAAFGGAAAAQDGSGANATDASSYEIAIDDYTRVVSSEWDGGELTLVVEADRTAQVTITDSSYTSVDGARDLRQRTVTVPGDSRTEISFTIENPDKPLVTAATSEDIVLLGGGSSGSSGGLPGISGDSTWFYVQIAALGAALGGGLAIGIVGWSKVADKHDSHEVVRP